MGRELFLILPYLYLRVGQRQKAINTFAKAMNFFPNNKALMLDFCAYLETFNIDQAKSKYLEIWETIFSDESFKLNFEMLNNVMVVFADDRENKSDFLIKKCEEELKKGVSNELE